ncbi:MAG: hypothetical protein KDK54_19665 [Leptospiraceae bacterium]|nr:hypothetical protein [Leptospiraceae bacterium]
MSEVVETYFQSGANKTIAVDETAMAISLSNTTKDDLELVRYSIKYDKSIVNLRNQLFSIRSLKGDSILFHIGVSVLGAEGSDFDQIPNFIEVPKKLIIPKSDGISLKIEKSSILIPSNSVYLWLEYKKVI